MIRVQYNDVIMSAMPSQNTSLTIVYSTVYSRHMPNKTSKLRVTGLCEGNSPVIGEFPAQRASNAENVCIWWPHHVIPTTHVWPQAAIHIDGYSSCIIISHCLRLGHNTLLIAWALCLIMFSLGMAKRVHTFMQICLSLDNNIVYFRILFAYIKPCACSWYWNIHSYHIEFFPMLQMIRVSYLNGCSRHNKIARM